MLCGRTGATLGPQGDPYYEEVLLLLKFEGTNGDTTTTDSSTYEHTVSLTGSGTTISNTEVGMDNSSTNIQGNTGVVDGGWSVTGSPLSQNDSDDYTIEWWMYVDYEPTTTEGVIDITDHARCTLDTFGRLSCTAYSPTIGVRFLGTSINSITEFTWHHVAMVRDGQTLRLYLNGVQESTDTLPAADSLIGSATDGTSGTVTIGYDGNGGHNDVYLDEVRWTHGTCRYTNGTSFTPPSREGDEYFSSVRLLTKFEEADGSITTADSSGYEHTLTRTLNTAPGDAGSTLEVDTAKAACGSGSLYTYCDAGGVNYQQISCQDEAFYLGNDDFTLEGWFNWNGSVGGAWYLLEIAGSPGFKIRGNNSNSRRYVDFDLSILSPTQARTIFTPQAANWVDDTWTHVAMSRNGDTVWAYINGVAVSSPSNPYTLPALPSSSNRVGEPGPSALNEANIGSRQANGSSPPGSGATGDGYGAWIDDVRVTVGIGRYPNGTTFTPQCSAGAAPVGFPVTKWQRYQG